MTNVDYAATYSKYPTPTPIHGDLTYKTLRRFKTELRANGRSVDTDLLSGSWLLGLILADLGYMRITPAPTRFQAPAWPEALVIVPTATAVEEMHSKEQHRELARVYRKC